MIKVLIVDDEPLVRIGMNSIIAWQEHGYVIVGEAGNGEQGLELIDQLTPDLVLVDIMMPQMDGIEMIDKAKKNGFQGKFIILSCVTELAYLQQAIRLGVSRYILKSAVKPQDILATIEEVAAELKKDQAHGRDIGSSYVVLDKDLVLHEFLNLVFIGVIKEPHIIAEKMLSFGFDATIPVYLQVYSAHEGGKSGGELLYKISTICKSMIEELPKGICFVSHDDYLVVILQTGNGIQAEEFSFRLLASAKQYFDTKLSVSRTEVDLHNWNLYECYAEQRHEIEKKFFDSAGVKQDRPLIPSTEFASYEKLSSTLGIIKNMMVQSSVVSENEAKKVFAGAIEYVVLMYELSLSEVLPQPPKETVLAVFSRCATFDEVHAIALEILKKCYQLAEQKGYCEYNDELTDRMVQYIHNHCNSRISTKDVANHVHFSIDYTCKYFKKKTQTNLTDYILKLKVYKSQQDLLDGMSVTAVADKYGFSSDGHFVKTFKRYESITPGAFVRLHTIV